MILMIDNYDSFTYNLVQYFGELGEKVIVHRNDKISLDKIKRINPEKVVISPGPCTPKESGISLDVISYYAGKVPILGVCLGHQAIGYVFGAKIIKAKKIMHGKISEIYHDNNELFKGIKSPFIATRYHSLVIEKKSMPKSLGIIAWCDDEEIMAIKHKKYPIWGVQFHPESILTKSGKQLLLNFLQF